MALPALALLFFLSGVSGLVYQVLWLRVLALVFGVTTWAAATVLSSFMGGLALGSFAGGRLADRSRTPLLWYGLAEILVGLSALATPAALELLVRLYAAVHPLVQPTPVLLVLVRFLLSFVVLMVPTTLMGATLPLVIKSTLLRGRGLGEGASLLYGSNTAGAIAGALLAGFGLIGGVGIRASFALAAALNVLVGVAAAASSRSLSPRGDGAVAAATARTEAALTPDDARLPAGARRFVLVAFAVSGFAALALEVIWFRVLVLFIQVSTYAFTIMLATVLGGIALGSYAVAPLMRRVLRWPALLVIVELAIGVASAASLATLAWSYDVRAWANPLVGSLRADSDMALMLVTSVLAILPATLLMGIAFPIGLRLYAGDSEPTAGERVGLFYSLNVFGAILGSVSAGFVLLPRLGSQKSLFVVSALSLAAGLLLLAALPRGRRALPGAAGALAVLLFAWAVRSTPDPFSVELGYRYPGERLLWHEEGVQTTVTVHERWDGTRLLYLDGIPQADDRPGMILLHRLIGLLPLALHPDPKDALVVGLGGGATPGAVSRHEGVRVDVVELSEAVVRSSEWFRHLNDDVLRRPNVTLRIDDGRNYMLLSSKRYDVITADIIHPFHAGSGNLYSVDYFRLARSSLRDGGLMLQWVGPFPESQYRLVVGAFAAAFPEATLWAQGSLMVGSVGPLRLDPAAFERKLENPSTRQALEAVGLGRFESLVDLYWGGPEEIRRYLGSGPVLTDDQPMVEYFLSLPRNEPLPDVTRLRGSPSRLTAR